MFSKDIEFGLYYVGSDKVIVKRGTARRGPPFLGNLSQCAGKTTRMSLLSRSRKLQAGELCRGSEVQRPHLGERADEHASRQPEKLDR